MGQLRIITIVSCILFFTGTLFPGQQSALKRIVLKGDDGGTVAGKEWNSGKLKGKTNLILYVVPQKKGDVMPLVKKIDSLNYSPAVLGVTFVINAKATSVPDFIIRRMIKKRAQSNKNVLYLLDRNRIMVNEWHLKDNDINVLLTDPSGRVLHNHNGSITKAYIENLVKIINATVKK